MLGCVAPVPDVLIVSRWSQLGKFERQREAMLTTMPPSKQLVSEAKAARRQADALLLSYVLVLARCLDIGRWLHNPPPSPPPRFNSMLGHATHQPPLSAVLVCVRRRPYPTLPVTPPHLMSILSIHGLTRNHP